jgi:hypothetical protein
MENGMTMGTFTNEIDQSFQANVDFGTLTSSFLFAGLGNPISGNPVFNDFRAFDTGFTGPFSVGYFMAGQLPISLFSSMNLTPLALRPINADYTVDSYSTVNVVSGTTTTVAEWLDQRTSYVATNPIYFNNYDVDLQALTKIGPAVVGLYLNLAADNSTADTAAAKAYNQTITDAYFYNTAGAGVTPVSTSDYTITTSATNINTGALPAPGNGGVNTLTDTLHLAIPFAMSTGTLDHKAFIDVSVLGSDRSGAYSLTETAHAGSVGGNPVTDRTINLTSTSSATDITLGYTLELPAGSAGDTWFAGVNLGLGFNGEVYSYDSLARPYNLSVSGAKTALAGGSHTTLSATFKTATDFSGGLSGGRVFAFQPATTIEFKVAPTLTLGLDTTSNGGTALPEGYTDTTQPLDATGAYDGSTYSTTTGAASGDPEKTFAITSKIELPMGLVIEPEGWKFNFFLGANPTVKLVSTTSTTSSVVSTETTTNYAGTAVSAVTITTTNPTNPGQATTTLVPSFSEVHYIGISVPFDGGVRFDARLNSSLLNFESFTIQAFIPLDR